MVRTGDSDALSRLHDVRENVGQRTAAALLKSKGRTAETGAASGRIMRRIMVGRARDGALYFGDITAENSAAMLYVSVHKVNRQMPMAQAWLRRELEAAS